DPGWVAMAGYDAARLAVEAVRHVESNATTKDARRAAALTYLRGLTNPLQAPPGLLGPLAFDANRGRALAMRVGRFTRGRLESAPLQIVPVRYPDPAELESGAVFPLRPGSYA